MGFKIFLLNDIFSLKLKERILSVFNNFFTCFQPFVVNTLWSSVNFNFFPSSSSISNNSFS